MNLLNSPTQWGGGVIGLSLVSSTVIFLRRILNKFMWSLKSYHCAVYSIFIMSGLLFWATVDD